MSIEGVVSPASSSSSSSSSSTPSGGDTMASPFHTPFNWKRIGIFLCESCRYIEFPGCPYHSQLFSRVSYYHPPRLLTSPLDVYDPPSHVVFSCSSCIDSADATPCRGCHLRRVGGGGVLAAHIAISHAHAELLRTAMISQHMSALVSTAMLYCKGCQACTIPITTSANVPFPIQEKNKQERKEKIEEKVYGFLFDKHGDINDPSLFLSSSFITSKSAEYVLEQRRMWDEFQRAMTVVQDVDNMINQNNNNNNNTAAPSQPNTQSPDNIHEHKQNDEPQQEHKSANEEDSKSDNQPAPTSSSSILPSSSSSSSSSSSPPPSISSSSSSSSTVSPPAATAMTVDVVEPSPASGAAAAAAAVVAAAPQPTDAAAAAAAAHPFAFPFVQAPRFSPQILDAALSVAKSTIIQSTAHYFTDCQHSFEVIPISLSFSELNFLLKYLDTTPSPSINNYYKLHLCVRRGDINMIRRLIDSGKVDVNEKNMHGKTPLMIAAWYGRTCIVDYFLSLPSIKIDEVDRNGYSALDWALYWNHCAIVKLLAWAGAKHSDAMRRKLEDKRNKSLKNKKKSNTLSAQSPSTLLSQLTSLSSPQHEEHKHADDDDDESDEKHPDDAEEFEFDEPSASPSSSSSSNSSSSTISALPLWSSLARSNGPPPQALQHLNSCPDPFSSSPAQFNGVEILNAEKRKEVFLMGLHKRAGQQSEISQSFLNHPLFDRNLLRVIFTYVDAFTYPNLIAHSATTRHHTVTPSQACSCCCPQLPPTTTQLMPQPIDNEENVTAIRPQGQEVVASTLLPLPSTVNAQSTQSFSPFSRSRLPRRTFRSLTPTPLSVFNSAHPLSDQNQPFSVPWSTQSEKSHASHTRPAALASSDASANQERKEEKQEDDDNDDDATAESRALSPFQSTSTSHAVDIDSDSMEESGEVDPLQESLNDPDIKFLTSLISLYTPRTISLQTDLQPFLPSSFIPCDGSFLDPMLKPGRPDNVEETLGITELDELNITKQSQTDGLIKKWNKERLKEQKKQHLPIAPSSSPHSVTPPRASPPRRTSIHASSSSSSFHSRNDNHSNVNSESVESPENGLRGEIFALLAPFKDVTQAVSPRNSASSAQSVSPYLASTSSSSSHVTPLLSAAPLPLSSSSSIISPVFQTHDSLSNNTTPQRERKSSFTNPDLKPNIAQPFLSSPSSFSLSHSLQSSPSSSSLTTVSPLSLAAPVAPDSVVSGTAYLELLNELHQKTAALQQITDLVSQHSNNSSPIKQSPNNHQLTTHSSRARIRLIDAEDTSNPAPATSSHSSIHQPTSLQAAPASPAFSSSSSSSSCSTSDSEEADLELYEGEMKESFETTPPSTNNSFHFNTGNASQFSSNQLARFGRRAVSTNTSTNDGVAETSTPFSPPSTTDYVISEPVQHSSTARRAPLSTANTSSHHSHSHQHQHPHRRRRSKAGQQQQASDSVVSHSRGRTFFHAGSAIMSSTSTSPSMVNKRISDSSSGSLTSRSYKSPTAKWFH